MKEGAHAFGRGVVWSGLFLILLSSVSGVAAMLTADAPLYAAFFLPSALLAGVTLRKWEGG